MKTARTAAFIVLFLLTADHLLAQDLPRFLVEARFGNINSPAGGFLNLPKGNHFMLGGLFSYRPMPAEQTLLGRVTFRGSLDGAGIGGQTVATGFRNRERLYLLDFAVGLDVVQSSRFFITLHGGAAVSRDRLVLQGYSAYGGTFRTGGFVNACRSGPDYCQSIWNFLGNGGVEGCWTFREDSPFFVGADYTRFAGGKNQIMFTTGLTF